MSLKSLFLPLLFAVLFAACGSSAGPGARTGGEAEAELTEHELAKLDEALRERLDGPAERFPIRVEFARLPDRDELESLLLVPYERVAIGEVDRATLTRIAVRPDVNHISLLTGTGYAPDENVVEL